METGNFHLDAYKEDMYAQDDACSVANTPLFSLLFPGRSTTTAAALPARSQSCRDILRMYDSMLARPAAHGTASATVGDAPAAVTAPPIREVLFSQEVPQPVTPWRARVEAWHLDAPDMTVRSEEARGLSGQSEAAASIVDLSATTTTPVIHHFTSVEDPSRRSQKRTMSNQAHAADPHEDEDDAEEEDRQPSRLQRQTRAAHQMPFRLRLKEVEKRFCEQMEVHRGITTALQRVEAVSREAQLLQAEQQTAALAEKMRERQAAAFAHLCLAVDPFPSHQLTAHETVAKDVHAAASPASPTTSQRVPPRPPALSSKSAVNPLLQDILQTFSKPKELRISGSDSSTSSRSTAMVSNAISTSKSKQQPQKKKRLPADVVRPPETPQPYKRVYYVPVEHRPTSTVMSTPAAPSVSVAIDDVTAAYSDDFDEDVMDEATGHLTESVVHSVASASRLLNQSSVSTEETENDRSKRKKKKQESSMMSSIVSSVADIPSAPSSLQPSSSSSSSVADKDAIVTDTDGTESVAYDNSNGADKRHRKVSAAGVSNAALVETLRQFFLACRRANEVAAMLSGDGGGLNEKQRKALKMTADGVAPCHRHRHRHAQSSPDSASHEHDDVSAKSSVSFHEEGQQQWLRLLQQDYTDMRRLRVFNKRLKEGLTRVDLQRKTRAAKVKLLRKAQLLSRAHQGLQRRPSARLSDVLDEVLRDEDVSGVMSDGVRAKKKRSKKRRSGWGGGVLGTDDDDASIPEDILSDIEDDFGLGRVGVDGSIETSIEDELEFQGGDGGGIHEDSAIADDIEDEWDVSGSSSGGAVDSEIEEEINLIANGGRDSELESILDDVSEYKNSEEVLDDEELGFANRLADASDVEDLIDEVPDLQYEDINKARRQRRRPSYLDTDTIEDSAVGSHFSLRTASVDSLVHLTTSAAGRETASHVSDEKSLLSSRSSGASVLSPASQSSSSHAMDGDVSSVFPASSMASLNSSDVEEMAEAEAADALRDLEADIELTKPRRKRALLIATSAAALSPFSHLYDPNVRSELDQEEDSFADTIQDVVAHKRNVASEEEAASAAVVEQPEKHSEAKSSKEVERDTTRHECRSNNNERVEEAKGKLLQPLTAYEEERQLQFHLDGKEQSNVELNEEQEKKKMDASLTCSPRVAQVRYIADDLVVLNQWKERQKEMMKQIFEVAAGSHHHYSGDASVETSGDGEVLRNDDGHVVESDSALVTEDADRRAAERGFAYHWGVLEALLETRFCADPLPDYDDWSSASDAEDGVGSGGESADAEISA